MVSILCRTRQTTIQRIVREVNPSTSLRNVRCKSTSAPKAKAAPSTSESAEGFDWQQYLATRRSRRKWQNAMTVPCAFAGLVAGAAYFGGLETDPTKPIMGIDPFFFYGICTVGTMGAGAIVGPTLGTAIWRATNGRIMTAFDAKDRKFFQHLKRNRVDPSLQSPTSPLPDSYGEKIGDLHGYRRWLRDQNKYRRKAQFSEE